MPHLLPESSPQSNNNPWRSSHDARNAVRESLLDFMLDANSPAISIFAPPIETSPAATPGLEKGGGVGPVTPPHC